MKQADRRTDAALLYDAAGFSTSGQQLMGINAASEGFVWALARYGGAGVFTALVKSAAESEQFGRVVEQANPGRPWRAVGQGSLEAVAELGTLLLPGPNIAGHAWQRQALGAAAYSLVGITHTTATPRVMDALVALPAAPVEAWDAVVCTSEAVRRMVLRLIEDQEAHLRARFGLRGGLPRPELPVIPLGVDCAGLVPDPALRRDWRARLGVGADDVVALYLGRLNHFQKAHPIPLFMAMAAAAQRLARRSGRAAGQRLLLVMAGWFPGEAVEAGFRAAARAYCPDVPVLFMDGRLPEVQTAARAMADLFVSPVDNVQETFGLAPLEAMAAGLPVVASDWDGYRDTVRDGVDGFLVPTLAPGAGVCDDLALRFSEGGLEGYGAQMGAVGQAVVVDVAAMAMAIGRLAGDAALRRRMGVAAMGRARAFDWAVVVARHRELWAALAEVRARAVRAPGRYPARPDPFHAFAGYASDTLSDLHRVRETGGSAAQVAALFASPLVQFGQTAPEEAELVQLLGVVDGGTVGRLVRLFPRGRRREAYRAVLWLAKFGLVAIDPPVSAPARRGSGR